MRKNTSDECDNHLYMGMFYGAVLGLSLGFVFGGVVSSKRSDSDTLQQNTIREAKKRDGVNETIDVTPKQSQINSHTEMVTPSVH